MDLIVMQPDGSSEARRLRLEVGRSVTLGRDQSVNDVPLPGVGASRQHAEITALSEREVRVRDLGSANGTLHRGQRIDEVVLDADARLVLGDVEVRVERYPSRAGGAGPGRGWRAALIGVGAVVVVVALVAAAVAVLRDRRSSTAAPTRTRPKATTTTVPPSPEKAAAVAGPRTASILINGSSNGSGWVLNAEKGLVVTNHHVVDQGGTIQAVIGGRARAARLVGTTPCEDVAVLSVDDRSGLQALELGSQADLKQGQEVVALGFPTNAGSTSDLTVTRGVVSVVQSSVDTPDFPRFRNVIRHDAPINPGNSGGPLVDLNGRLLGMNSLSAPDHQSESYALGVDWVSKVVVALQRGSFAWNGLSLKSGGDNSLTVESIANGTPAQGSGLRDGDVITAVNGAPVSGHVGDYCRMVENNRVGSSASYVYSRPDAGGNMAGPFSVAISFL